MWVSPGADVGLLSSDSSPPLDFLSCLRAWWVRARGGHAGRYPHSAHTANAGGEPHRSLPFFFASSVSARFASLPGAPQRETRIDSCGPCVSACALVRRAPPSANGRGGAAVMTQCAVSMPQCPLSPWDPLVLLSTP